MKATLFQLVLLLVLGVSTTPAIAQHYNFIFTSDAYVELTDQDFIVPDDSPYWGNVKVVRNMTFPAFTSSYDLSKGVFTVLESGYVYLINNTRSFTLYALKSDLKAREGQTSEFSFKLTTEGVVKVLKLQWKNMGLSTGVPSEFINYQLWLYEDGRIEIRFGECNITETFAVNGPVVGLLEMDEEFSTIYNEGYLHGTMSSPTYEESSIVLVSGGPTSGSVLKFTPATSALVANKAQEQFPQIHESSGRLYVLSLTESAGIAVHNTLGQTVLNSIVDPSQSTDVRHLPAGVYHATVTINGEVVASQMFVKR